MSTSPPPTSVALSPVAVVDGEFGVDGDDVVDDDADSDVVLAAHETAENINRPIRATLLDARM